MGLLQPVLHPLPGLYQCRLVIRQAVDLFLPLGVAPLVPGFEDRQSQAEWRFVLRPNISTGR